MWIGDSFQEALQAADNVLLLRGDYEALRYTNRLISGWSWDRADYNVILHNGRVVEYGLGGVKQRDPDTSILILVPVK